MTAQGKRVAVIGAGASGLPASKIYLEDGLEPVCFERSDDVGGLWYFQEQVREGYSTVIKTTISNTSKEMSCYSDFLMPKEFPNYFPHRYAFRYFRLYTDHFDLDRHIRYNTEVTKVRRADDYAESGRWIVESTDHKNGSKNAETFDAVLVCSGHHSEKHVPQLTGMSDFKGPVLHAHDYRQDPSYDDKKILVVGMGNTGGDVAVELSWQAEQVYLSTRGGSFVFHNMLSKGLPPDYCIHSRYQNWVEKNLSGAWVEAKMAAMYQQSVDHDLFTLTPKSAFSSPFLNGSLFSRINCGQIKVKENVEEFTPTGVKFVDGSYEDIDVVILATGYLIGYPFVEKEVIDVKDNKILLYKRVFQPDLLHQTLAFIGCVQPIGCLWPMSEMQARLATAVFKGDVKLPSREDMWNDITAHEEMRAAIYPNTQRHTISVDFLNEMDELADIVGCKPNIGKYYIQDTFQRTLLKDPRLAYHLIFGGAVAAQYRLEGPGRWEGAREAVIGADERMRFPLRTRTLPPCWNRWRRKTAEWIMFPSMWWTVLLELLVFVLVLMQVFG